MVILRSSSYFRKILTQQFIIVNLDLDLVVDSILILSMLSIVLEEDSFVTSIEDHIWYVFIGSKFIISSFYYFLFILSYF